MSQPPVHIWFCSKDGDFAQVIGRALGGGFEVRHGNRTTPEALAEMERWCNVVVLDLCTAEFEQDLEEGLKTLGEINKVALPPPVIVPRSVLVKPNCAPHSANTSPRMAKPIPAAIRVKKLAQKILPLVCID